VQLKIRSGKYSAECYYTDERGQRRRVLRATGIRADGSTDAQRTAEQVGRTIEAKLNGARGPGAARKSRGVGTTTLERALESFVASKRRAGASDRAVGLELRSAVHPLRFFGPDCDPWDVDDAALERYADYSLQKRRSSTVLRELATLRGCLRAAKVDPRPKFPRLAEGAPRELAFDVEQSQRLIAGVPDAPGWRGWPLDWPTRRDYVLMYRLLGLSYAELFTIAPDGINWTAHTVRVRGTKRETRDRVLPMTAAVEAVLRRALEHMQRRRDATLWPCWSNVKVNEYLTAVAQRVGLVAAGTRVSVNVLRASFCTELVRRDVHPAKIARLMGHANTKTAMRWYTRLRAETDLHDAVATLAPYGLGTT